MADQLFRKRKAKKAADLARKQAARDSYDKVLIVCEGSKTEPNYLIELINDLKLSTANVEVDGKCGSDPVSVVERVEELVQLNKRQKGIDNYDRVFCVFDRDEHDKHGGKFTQAVNKISRIRHPGISFSAITSTPCFEVWLIMHFEPLSRPFDSSGRFTAAEEVIRYLKSYIADYGKGDRGLYNAVSQQTQQAISFAKRLERHNAATGADNPSTDMHKLVEYLLSLKVI